MSTASAQFNEGKVTPSLGLGSSFEEAPKRALEFSTAAVVAGAASSDSWEPTDAIGLDEEAVDLNQLRAEIFRRDGRCVYCGLRTATLEVDCVNDLHIDLSPENLAAVDAICHGYHHLNELSESQARVAYLPGLDPTDVNHLQRLLITELHEGDAEDKAVAKDLITWMASHDKYTKDAFGTSNPASFGRVIAGVNETTRMRRGVAFEGLALVYNPTKFRHLASVWRGELLAAHPRSKWASFFQDVMRLLA